MATPFAREAVGSSSRVHLSSEAYTPAEGYNNPNVYYVFSGQSTGWAAMAEKVRDYDKDKVKDTKEDINTLLVFAGLFSAVLTAFLVESYKNLSPDTSSQMLAVMQQIALQTASYNVINDVINATSPPPSIITNIASQPFDPSPVAIRVNVLWFSSLIFSLTTASFGMLVKQWLREYLAVENPSPQARLRIRHFRYPELKRWKVLEIAAILPLLQQVSLALFFLGLCYFTASVHQSVGHTSLPLVVGWAFCFSLVTILPAFFPRCPYKTTFLKRALLVIHTTGWKVFCVVRHPLVMWWVNIRRGYWLESITWWARDVTPRFVTYNHGGKSAEERAVVSEKADLDILVDVDALQSDDELLGSTIVDSLHQIQPQWVDVVSFLLRILQHRLPRETIERAAPEPLDMGTVGRACWTAVISTLSFYADVHLLSSVHSDQAVARWQTSKTTLAAFYLFFSPARHPLPQIGVKVLKEILEHKGTELMHALGRNCHSEHYGRYAYDGKFHLLVQGVSQVLDKLDVGLTRSILYFESLMNGYVGRVYGGDAVNPYSIRTNFSTITSFSPLSNDAARCAAVYFISAVQRALRHMELAATAPQNLVADTAAVPASAILTDALVGMWHMSHIAQRQGFMIDSDELAFRSAIDQCLSTPESTFALVQALGRVELDAVVYTTTPQWWREAPIGPWLLSEDPQRRLNHLISAARKLGSAPRDEHDDSPKPAPLSITHLLFLCFVALRMLSLPEALRYRDLWRTLMDVLTRLGEETLRNEASQSAHPSASPVSGNSISSSPDPQLPITTPLYEPHSQTAQLDSGYLRSRNTLLKMCLVEVNAHDGYVMGNSNGHGSAPALGPSVSIPNLQDAYETWSAPFRDEDHSLIGDGMVRMLVGCARAISYDEEMDNGFVYFGFQQCPRFEALRRICDSQPIAPSG